MHSVYIDLNIQLTNMQFFYSKDEARVETVTKIVPNFVYYNHLRRSNLSDLAERKQSLIYDNHKVIASVTLQE